MGAATFTDQRHQALAKANAVRVERARLLHALASLDTRSGYREAVRLLERPPAALRSATVWQLLVHVRRSGRSKTGRVLNVAGVSSTRRLGELTARQKSALVSQLERRT